MNRHGTFLFAAMLSLVLILVWAFASPAAAAGNFGAALAGWWRFDACGGGQAADDSGLANHGTVQGDVAFTGDALLGCALNFSGPSGSVVVAHDASLEPATGTVQAWVKVAQPRDADVVMKTTDLFVRSGISGGFSVYGLRIDASGRALGFVANDDPTAPGPWTFAISPANAVTAGTWHHLAFRWDGSTVAVFVDGVLQAATPYDPVPGSGLSYHGASTFGLGVATAGGGEFTGQLDDVRFYGRARSDLEIFADYATAGHKPAKPPGQ